MGIRVDAVMDIETQDWSEFVLGGVLDASGTYKDFWWTSEEGFVDELLMRGGHIWTWNGGLFDSLWLLQKLRKRGYRVTCSMAGTRVIRFDCEGLSVHDGIALVPMSLKAAARIAGIDLEKNTGLECKCGSACGGYCAIRRQGMGKGERANLRAYLRKDCEATLAILLRILEEGEKCSYLLGATVGGSAYKTAKHICNLEDAIWDSRIYRFVRSAYYGGRVEVFRPRSAKGFAYDINSAYPAALVRVPLPIGALLSVRGTKAQRCYKRERPGVYLACISVPKTMHVPPLPVRTPKGRIVFPTGEFSGVWPLIELQEAERRGCRVRVVRGVVFSDSEMILAPFMTHGWACREDAKAAGNDSLAAWHKWVLNSCTGKFAENPSKERLIINPSAEEVRVCECDAGNRTHCRCRPWRPYDMEGEIWAAPFWRISHNSHIHWAAYLTSATRIQLLEQLTADGQGGTTAIYCDTDSCYSTAEKNNDIGPDLGQWKCEGEVNDWHSIAPKVYRFERAGRIVVKGKGLPGLDSNSFSKFERGEPFKIDRGVMGLRSAARGESLFRRKHMSRQNHADGIHYGGRVLGRDGLTHPRSYREVLQWENDK